MNASHIWCHNCEAVRPLIVDVMDGTDTTGRYTEPTDLVCAKCKLIICTTYNKPPAQGGHQERL